MAIPTAKLQAPRFRKFNDLCPEDVSFDFHMHTTHSDGANSPTEMCQRARELSLKAIALTDHVNRGCSWFPQFRRGIEALREAGGLTVYIGIEAKALDFEGALDASDDVLESAELVVGSVHRYPDGHGGLVPLQDVRTLGQVRAAEMEFELAMGLVRNRRNGVHVLGHPFGVYSKFFDQIPAASMEALMSACAETGVAFEISTRYCADLASLVQMLRRVNPPVSIGSDAHCARDLGRDFDSLRQEISRWR